MTQQLFKIENTLRLPHTPDDKVWDGKISKGFLKYLISILHIRASSTDTFQFSMMEMRFGIFRLNFGFFTIFIFNKYIFPIPSVCEKP